MVGGLDTAISKTLFVSMILLPVIGKNEEIRKISVIQGTKGARFQKRKLPSWVCEDGRKALVALGVISVAWLAEGCSGSTGSQLASSAGLPPAAVSSPPSPGAAWMDPAQLFEPAAYENMIVKPPLLALVRGDSSTGVFTSETPLATIHSALGR